jgi:hypothetical protein
MLGESFLKKLDARAALGFDVWDFSLHSLSRAYGRLFLASAVLRHPIHTLRGLKAYRLHTRPAREKSIAPVGMVIDKDILLESANEDLVVGMGYCQKPFDPMCPSGRFNHRCWYLTQRSTASLPEACSACRIREIAEHALPAGAAMHIMTSAVDIAHDLLLPGLRGSVSRSVILSICPYSVAPMTLAMNICRVQGLVLPYREGACADFAEWVRADEGDKPEQTCLSTHGHRNLLDLLDRFAQHRSSGRLPEPSHYEEAGHLYVPAV